MWTIEWTLECIYLFLEYHLRESQHKEPVIVTPKEYVTKEFSFVLENNNIFAKVKKTYQYQF
jgi:hypothetical protein